MLPEDGLASFLLGFEYHIVFKLGWPFSFWRWEASAHLREDQDVDVPFFHVVAEQGDGWRMLLLVQNNTSQVERGDAKTVLTRLLLGRGRVVVIGVLRDDLQEVVGDV